MFFTFNIYSSIGFLRPNWLIKWRVRQGGKNNDQCNSQHDSWNNITNKISLFSVNKFQDNDDGFLRSLNETATKTSRDLKLKKPYKLLKLKISQEIGFAGNKYKKAVGVLQHPKKNKKRIIISMPRPVAYYNKRTLKEIKSRIEKGKNPIYIVNKITSKQRPDKKGHYDLIDFRWA